MITAVAGTHPTHEQKEETAKTMSTERIGDQYK